MSAAAPEDPGTNQQATMEVDGGSPGPLDNGVAQATSLGFLQLQDAFKRMVAVGADVVDEQAFYRVMHRAPEHLLWPMWQLYVRVIQGIVDNAMAEFGDIAAEVGLAQQMADVEALALARGRPAGADAGGPCDEPAAGPAAAAAAARVAAKRAERQQLADALARAQRQRADLRAQVDGRAKAVAAAKAAYARAADQMGEVHAAMCRWRPDALVAPAAAASQ